MKVEGFIAGRLRFKGRIAAVSIAVSFFVMILSVAVSSGFRKEIRCGASSFCGDIQLTSVSMDYINEDSPINARPSFYGSLESLQGVKTISPAIYRAGIVKKDDSIHGVIFKGIEGADSLSGLGVRVPSHLCELLGLGVGDRLTSYFIGENVKVRNFTVREVYDGLVDIGDALMVYASIDDMRRLNGWDSLQVSALEITLEDAYKSGPMMSEMTSEVGSIALLSASDDDDTLLAASVKDKYPQVFNWLDLIDFNVLFILLLMTVVAGFNMISGLLILLFQNISTIGTLKSMGMTDRSIAGVFLRVSSVLVLKGMAVGNALAFLFCGIQSATHLIKLNPDNYFVSFVPVSINVPMTLLADAGAYAAIMLLLLIPCIFISKVDPAQTVRAQ